MKKKFGTLAFPAKHSVSPAMQNAAFKKMGVDAEFGVFEVAEAGFERFMKDFRKNKIAGAAVSLPYKERVIKYLDVVSADAKKIGAVNTILNRGGKLCGDNTDFLGAVRALTDCVRSLRGKKVAVLGAGGAARAIIYGLLKEGAEVTIINRNKAHAEKIVRDMMAVLGRRGSTLRVGSEIATDRPVDPKGDILIQATSIWTLNPKISKEEIEKFCPDSFVKKFKIVMDICYKPRMTPLLIKAKKLRKKIITGDRMLLYQAAEQFKIWTGKRAPIEVMMKTIGVIQR